MELSVYSDEHFMNEAYKEALIAFEEDEVPVGAIITFNNKIIAKAHNQTELLNDVTAHAEIIAITSAASALGGKYLKDCCLYVTLEPCVMCAGALYLSQISKIFYSAKDSKRGYSLFNNNILHPKTEVYTGLLQDKCSALMSDFFKNKRK